MRQSPRWLISHGKFDEALHVLGEYHGDHQSQIVQFEYNKMKEEITQDTQTTAFKQRDDNGPAYETFHVVCIMAPDVR